MQFLSKTLRARKAVVDSRWSPTRHSRWSLKPDFTVSYYQSIVLSIYHTINLSHYQSIVLPICGIVNLSQYQSNTYHFVNHTAREMQGIVGQASEGWSSKFIFEKLSQWSTELACGIFHRERSRKAKTIGEQRLAKVFCVNTAAHAQARLSYEFRWYVFVRYEHCRASQDLIVIVLNTAFACQWKGRRTSKRRTDLNGSNNSSVVRT